MSFNSRYTVRLDTNTPVSGDSYTGQFGPNKSTVNSLSFIRFAGNVQGINRDLVKTLGMGEGSGPFNIVQNFSGEQYPELVRTTPCVTGAGYTFATTAAKNYQILGLGASNSIAGFTSTLLQSPGQEFTRRSIAGVVVLRSSFLQSLSWSVTATGDAGLPVYTASVVTSTGNFISQNNGATNPANLIGDFNTNYVGRLEPGQLVFSINGISGSELLYSPKLGG